MNFLSRLLLLNKLLEDGNVLFKQNRLSDASHRYQYALRRLPSSLPANSGQHRLIFEQLQTHLLLNLSRCKRKLKLTSEALELADQVLKINPLSFEAYYAKAKANREAGNLHEAVGNLTEASRVAPQNREVHRVILKIKSEINMAESKLLILKDGGSREGDSTSGVDSSGSMGSAKEDFDNSLVI